MIRRGFVKRVNDIIDEILMLIDELDMGIEFDNMIPNKYTLITKYGRYEFSTYKDVYNALVAMLEVKRG